MTFKKQGIAALAAWGLCVAAAAEPNVLFFADPQIHNVYGGYVKQTWRVSDLVSPVARRQPETNLLAVHGMQDLIERGRAGADKSTAPLIVVLGDATNLACTGEFARFMKAVDAVKGDDLLLMAHGNHDSYLMGTLNYWQETREKADISAFAKQKFPQDASWFRKPAAPGNPSEWFGWKALCSDTQYESGPMNKIQWMAKYIASLTDEENKKRGGLKLDSINSGGETPTFTGKGTDGSKLKAIDYFMQGQWTRPSDAGDGLLRTYDSFLVQAFNIGDTHRLILVDTSACASITTSGWMTPRFLAQNAGTHACMGDAQLTLLKDFIQKQQEKGRKLVFAGHFPLKDFNIAQKLRFINLMSSTGKDWTYLSAHTHDPMSDLDLPLGGREINIGSTTDWPMAAFRIRFGQRLWASPIPAVQPTQEYDAPPEFPDGPELCRHAEAAVVLANLSIDTTPKIWRSPSSWGLDGCNYMNQNEWLKLEQSLADAEERIEQRMNGEPRYRERVLGILAASSLYESKKWSVLTSKLGRRLVK